VADDPRFRCPPRRARPQRALSGSVGPQRISAFRLRRDFRGQVPAACRF
jgi:hypothetical protein